MKIVIRKVHDYPGSTFRRVDLVLGDGTSIPLFGVWKETRGITLYESDTTAQTWRTLAQVKAYAEALLDPANDIAAFVRVALAISAVSGSLPYGGGGQEGDT
jgi:hypothetical protein